jgi:hypothetical protein
MPITVNSQKNKFPLANREALRITFTAATDLPAGTQVILNNLGLIEQLSGNLTPIGITEQAVESGKATAVLCNFQSVVLAISNDGVSVGQQVGYESTDTTFGTTYQAVGSGKIALGVALETSVGLNLFRVGLWNQPYTTP